MKKLWYFIYVIIFIVVFRLFQNPTVANAVQNWVSLVANNILIIGVGGALVVLFLVVVSAPDSRPTEQENATPNTPAPKGKTSEKPKQPTVKPNCQYCNGRGETQEYDPCGLCGGTGQIYVQGFNTCLGCGGAGRKLQNKRCGWCNGGGKA